MSKKRRKDLLETQQSGLGAAEDVFEPAVTAVSLEESDRQRWRSDIGGDIFASPTVIDGTIFIGAIDRTLYAVDADSGSVLWSVDLYRHVRTAATVADGSVLLGTNGTKLLAIDPASGEE